MKRYTFYASTLGGILPGEGSMLEEPDGGYCSWAEAKETITSVLFYLESDYVQRNSFRLGALGSGDIANAILCLRNALNYRRCDVCGQMGAWEPQGQFDAVCPACGGRKPFAV